MRNSDGFGVTFSHFNSRRCHVHFGSVRPATPRRFDRNFKIFNFLKMCVCRSAYSTAVAQEMEFDTGRRIRVRDDIIRLTDLTLALQKRKVAGDVRADQRVGEGSSARLPFRSALSHYLSHPHSPYPYPYSNFPSLFYEGLFRIFIETDGGKVITSDLLSRPKPDSGRK